MKLFCNASTILGIFSTGAFFAMMTECGIDYTLGSGFAFGVILAVLARILMRQTSEVNERN